MRIDFIKAEYHPGHKTKLTIVVDKSIEEVSKSLLKWQSCPHNLEIKEEKHRRSLDANSKYQVLLDRLSGVLGTSRDELHEMMLQRYGVTKMSEGRPVIVTLRSDIPGHCVFPYVEALKTGEKDGVSYTAWRVLKRSSEMDSKEFSHLLDGLISECKELGIETEII